MVAETKTDWPIVNSSFARNWLNRLAPFLGLVLVIVVFAILIGAPEKYLSLKNLRTVLAQTVIVAIGAIGMTVIIISGGIDLSVGSAIALTGVITAIGISAGWPTTIAVGAGILVGGLVGMVNGLAITRLRVVPFIATLGMLGVARGVAKGLAGSQTVNVPDTWANDLLLTVPKHAWLLVAPGVWIAILLAIIAAVVLRRTVFGRRVFALAGVMQMSRLRQGDPTVAAGLELDIIAAVVIGGGSLSGGEGSILGAMIGALIMAFLR